jgi:hypothetical protein
VFIFFVIFTNDYIIKRTLNTRWLEVSYLIIYLLVVKTENNIFYSLKN